MPVDAREDQISPAETPALKEREAGEDARHSRLRRPWRWVLGAISIAAVGAGVIFISRRGIRKPE